jgi:RNA polymerase sigma factor (sigma-70 family)
MSSAQVSTLLRFMRQLSTGWKDGEMPDHQLLERFTTLGDEDAFAALLRRHGPMVLRVCQSVLHNRHDAEDVFQAVFLVLARKAGSIHRREAVSSWLYGVAHRLAMKAQASAARRKDREKRAAMPSTEPLLDMSLVSCRGSCTRNSSVCPKCTERLWCCAAWRRNRCKKRPACSAGARAASRAGYNAAVSNYARDCAAGQGCSDQRPHSRSGW